MVAVQNLKGEALVTMTILKALTAREVDGSTLTDGNPHELRLPFLFRGRDFNATNDLFLTQLL